jgi:hypothetical protein
VSSEVSRARFIRAIAGGPGCSCPQAKLSAALSRWSGVHSRVGSALRATLGAILPKLA